EVDRPVGVGETEAAGVIGDRHPRELVGVVEVWIDADHHLEKVAQVPVVVQLLRRLDKVLERADPVPVRAELLEAEGHQTRRGGAGGGEEAASHQKLVPGHARVPRTTTTAARATTSP